MEDPSNRTFSGDPVATVLADRGRYIAATLTIARAYLVAGQPNQPRRLASFERWSDLVCGALRWLKWEDPVNTMSVLRADDPTRQHLAAVLGQDRRSWACGMVSKYRLMSISSTHRIPCVTSALRRSCRASCADRPGRIIRVEHALDCPTG